MKQQRVKQTCNSQAKLLPPLFWTTLNCDKLKCESNFGGTSKWNFTHWKPLPRSACLQPTARKTMKRVTISRAPEWQKHELKTPRGNETKELASTADHIDLPRVGGPPTTTTPSRSAQISHLHLRLLWESSNTNKMCPDLRSFLS